MDGAATLEEAADRLEDFARRLRLAHSKGFFLDAPISDDRGFVCHKEGKRFTD